MADTINLNLAISQALTKAVLESTHILFLCDDVSIQNRDKIVFGIIDALKENRVFRANVCSVTMNRILFENGSVISIHCSCEKFIATKYDVMYTTGDIDRPEWPIGKIVKIEFEEDIVVRLEKRATIRRNIPTRKSVINGEPDRIADLLEEAARVIKGLRMALKEK